MTPHQHPLEKAIDKIGNATALAGALKVSVQAVGQWKNNIRPIPPERCVEIERLTDGEVTAESLSPGSRWVRTGDAAWPHPDGRPLLDVAAGNPEPVTEKAGA